MKPPRIFYLLLFLGSSTLLSFGYYLQFFQDIEPCPLCIFQRVTFIAVILFSLSGLIHGPQSFWLRIYSGLILIASLIGGGIAAWQVRLQHLPPDKIPDCGPGLDYMLDVFPLFDVIKMAFTGSGECAEVVWTFLTLSIPEWSLICFFCIAVLSSIHLVRKRLFAMI